MKYLLLLFLVFLACSFAALALPKRLIKDEDFDEDICAASLPNNQDYWTFLWCPRNFLKQVHINPLSGDIETSNDLDVFLPDGALSNNSESFRSQMFDCFSKSSKKHYNRIANVYLKCCENFPGISKGDGNLAPYIEKVEEIEKCNYNVSVCQPSLCSLPPKSQDSSSNSLSIPYINDTEIKELRIRAEQMFYKGYDAYMEYAFPEGELRPLSCKGGPFDPIKLPMVTLIDSLDTLVVLKNFTEFRRAVSLVSELPNFDFDTNISVFETTIRILGGLLSAHLFCIDKILNIYDDQNVYDNSLLRLAIDLGNRLLPAFETKTGIPYGTVNLRYGVPEDETEIASTAGAGSLFMEFYVLSVLSNNDTFSYSAYRALQGLYERKSTIGLYGKHINTNSGKWSESISGIGSNSDSFYEYLLKSSLLANNDNLKEMFVDAFISVKQHVQLGDWFGDVDMYSGKSRRNRVENLHAFWPGMEAMLGFVVSSSQLLNAFYAMWSNIGFLPEEVDQNHWLDGKISGNRFYPLRPELIESTYYHYRSTRDRSWLFAGKIFLESIEKHTPAKCGYASIGDVDKLNLIDNMPSFFLSETCKYLYLLFDEKNFVNRRPFIFSTEAHPFDVQVLESIRQSFQPPMIVKQTKISLLKFYKAFINPDLRMSRFPEKLPQNLYLRERLEQDVIQPNEHDFLSICPRRYWFELRLPFSQSYQTTLVRKQDYPVFSSVSTFTSKLATDKEKKIDLLWNHISLSFADSFDQEKRRKLITHDFADDLAWKSMKSRSWQRSMPPMYSDDTCWPSDNVRKNNLEFNVRGIGKFVIKSTNTGFIVKSSQSGIAMEVFNLNKNEAFAREVKGERSSLTMMSSEHVVRCSVQLVDQNANTLFERHCTSATFTRSRDLPIYGAVVTPSLQNGQLCKPEEPVPDFVSLFKSLANKLAGLQDDTNVVISRLFDDKIVIVPRGECTFIKKAYHAQQSGAKGMIVVNSDDNVFIMHGSKKSEEADSLPTVIDIPVVLMSNSDAKAFAAKLLDVKNHDATSIRVESIQKHVLLDSIWMGDYDYPKIRYHEDVIQAISSSNWGVVITKTSEMSSIGSNWQLYIAHARDFDSPLSLSFKFSHHDVPFCTNPSFELNPAKRFQLFVQRKCSSNIELNQKENRIEWKT